MQMATLSTASTLVPSAAVKQNGVLGGPPAHVGRVRFQRVSQVVAHLDGCLVDSDAVAHARLPFSVRRLSRFHRERADQSPKCAAIIVARRR